MKIVLNDVQENQYTRIHTIDKPKGWLIMDSVNNPFFPIDSIQYDTGDFDLARLRKYFHQIYGGKPNDLFLPWHYTIDVVNQTPYVINTRPFNYKTPIPNFEKHLSIMIIGNTKTDIYDLEFYKTIAHFIINPFRFLNGFQLTNQRKIFTFKTKENFDIDKLMRYVIS